MKPVFAILQGLSVAVRRELGTFESIKLNNLFLFIGLMVWGAIQSGVEPVSAEPLILLLCVLLLFPLSADPLRTIPEERLPLWPLSQGQRLALRLISFVLSPVLWVAVLFLWLAAKPIQAAWVVAAAVLIQCAGALRDQAVKHSPKLDILLHVPQFPGRLGGLIRNNLRQMLSVLDFYAAALLSIGGCAYLYLSAHPDQAAPPILAMLVALTLSTYGQCLFGLDAELSAMTRYRLCPLRGWEILLSKDLAFLGILCLLIVPLHLYAGLTFGLTALAIGHHTSVMATGRQRRWRFTGGWVLPGVLQMVAGAALGFAEYQRGPAFLVAGVVAYLVSLGFYGWRFEQAQASPK